MQFLAFILIIVLMLFAETNAAQTETGHFPVEIFETMGGQRLFVFIDREDLGANPEWQPGEGSPPLSIGGALLPVDIHTAEYV